MSGPLDVLLNGGLDAVLISSPDGEIVDANDLASEVFGWSRDEILNRGRALILDTTDPTVSETLTERANRIGFRGEVRFRHRTGHAFRARVTTLLIDSDQGTRICTVVRPMDIFGPKLFEDSTVEAISTSVETSEPHHLSADRYQRMVESCPEGMFEVAWDGTGLLINQAFADLFGYSNVQDLIHEHCNLWDLVVERSRVNEVRDLLRRTGQVRNFEVSMTRKQGKVAVLSLTLYLVRDESGAPRTVGGLAVDVTEQKAREESFRLAAITDSLTGLPNRAAFVDYLRYAMTQAQATGGSVGLCFIDLDRFKEINDTLGHTAGDHVMREVAARLKQATRASDVVARIAGDEFVIVVTDGGRAGGLGDPDKTMKLLSGRIQRRLGQGIWLDGAQRTVSASIGWAIYPRDAQTEEELIRLADRAMYEKKFRAKETLARQASARK